MESFVTAVKQHPGPVQVTRRVKVKVPGKHFPHGHSELSPAEQREFDWGTAIEHKERHIFALHRKASGAAHSGPGIRFLCDSNAIDDPDHKGLWDDFAAAEPLAPRHLLRRGIG